MADNSEEVLCPVTGKPKAVYRREIYDNGKGYCVCAHPKKGEAIAICGIKKWGDKKQTIVSLMLDELELVEVSAAVLRILFEVVLKGMGVLTEDEVSKGAKKKK